MHPFSSSKDLFTKQGAFSLHPMASTSVDGSLLSDFLRTRQLNTGRAVFIVTGGNGCGKSTALRGFLSGCRDQSLSVSKLGSGQLEAEVFYGDYASRVEHWAHGNQSGLIGCCLVLDDVHIWSQMCRLTGRDPCILSTWPGHLVLSAPSLHHVPPTVLSKFIFAEYPIASSLQYATRRILESHPTNCKASALHLAHHVPRGTPTRDLVSFLGTAVAASRMTTLLDESAKLFSESFLASVSGKRGEHHGGRSLFLPPSLADVHERIGLLIHQHLSRFSDVESVGAVSRVSSSTTGILLSGPSGVGKTLLTFALEKYFPSVPFIRVGSHEFFAKYLGESEEKLRIFFREARLKSPCVVVMENIDVLAQRRSEGAEGSSVAKRILTALLCELDGFEDTQGVLVVGTTSAVDTIDGALLRQGRLETIVSIPALSETDVNALVASQSNAWETSIPVSAMGDLVGLPLSHFPLRARLLFESRGGNSNASVLH